MCVCVWCVCVVCVLLNACMHYSEAIRHVVPSTTTALTVMLTSTPEKHRSNSVSLLINILCSLFLVSMEIQGGEARWWCRRAVTGPHTQLGHQAGTQSSSHLGCKVRTPRDSENYCPLAHTSRVCEDPPFQCWPSRPGHTPWVEGTYN